MRWSMRLLCVAWTGSLLAGCSGIPTYTDCSINASFDSKDDGVLDSTTVLTYDAVGRIATSSTTNLYLGSGQVLNVSYSYADGPYPIKAIQTTTYGGVTYLSTITYTYTGIGNTQPASARYDSNGDGTIDLTTVYSASKDGRTIIAATDANSDGTTDEIDTYMAYDFPLYATGLLVLSTDSGADGTKEATYDYVFSADGALEAATQFTSTGDVGLLYTYEYDEAGNLTRATVTSADHLSSSTTTYEGSCYGG
jgi:YD repeat-containing protein